MSDSVVTPDREHRNPTRTRTMNPSNNQNPASKANRKRFIRSALGAGLGAAVVAATLAVTGGTAGAIVDGTPTTANQHPWQVSLQSDGGHFCGGTIVDSTTIVTAAHCLEGETAADLTIRAGVTESEDTGGQDRPVASITSHPDYAASEVGDIAIVKLAEPLSLGGNVQAIPTATAAELTAATSATVTGWGDTSEQGGAPTQLLEAVVPLVNDGSCSNQLGIDADREVCAGGDGKDSCYGDSGGPLTIQTADGPKLAGVVSWGEECGGATPGVYAEVPFYEDFVKNGAGELTVSPDQAGDANEGAEDMFEQDNADELITADQLDFDEEAYDDGAHFDEDFGDEYVYEVEIDGEWIEMTEAELDAFLDAQEFGVADDEYEADLWAEEDQNWYDDDADWEDSDWDDAEWDDAEFEDCDELDFAHF